MMYWNTHAVCFATSSLPPPRRPWMERQAPDHHQGKPVEGVWSAATLCLGKHRKRASPTLTEPLVLNVKEPLSLLLAAPLKPPWLCCSCGGRGCSRGRASGREGSSPGAPPGHGVRRDTTPNREQGVQTPRGRRRAAYRQPAKRRSASFPCPQQLQRWSPPAVRPARAHQSTQRRAPAPSLPPPPQRPRGVAMRWRGHKGPGHRVISRPDATVGKRHCRFRRGLLEVYGW